MKHKIICVIPVLMLTACVTDQLNSGFDRIRGQHLSVAINRLGVPTSERTIAGRHVYSWINSQLITNYQATNNFTKGKIGNDPKKSDYSGTSFGGTTSQINATCKIEMEVDDQKFIRNATYDGDIGACEKYAALLNR
jgi:hypothetical protein